MTKVKHGADAVALEQAIAVAEQRLLTSVDADDRGWQRLGAKEWKERIAASFASIRKLIPEILDPELDHRKWMANRYYRSGFELHAQGKSRNDSPYIEGVWTEQWQRGWDYADRSTKHTGSELPALEEITSLRAHNSDSAEPVAWPDGHDAYDECATEGCSNPGTVRFEAGQVGSDYCGDCARKIKALASPPAKEVSKEQIRRACSAAQKWGCPITSAQARAIIEAALTNRTPDDEVGNED